jgi:hypothetical protein
VGGSVDREEIFIPLLLVPNHIDESLTQDFSAFGFFRRRHLEVMAGRAVANRPINGVPISLSNSEPFNSAHERNPLIVTLCLSEAPCQPLAYIIDPRFVADPEGVVATGLQETQGSPR